MISKPVESLADSEIMEDRQIPDLFRFKDGVGAIGFGLSVNLFGLPAHWDFAKRWDFKESLDDGFRTYFWIGRRF